jgi:hypothetical protein
MGGKGCPTASAMSISSSGQPSPASLCAVLSVDRASPRRDAVAQINSCRDPAAQIANKPMDRSATPTTGARLASRSRATPGVIVRAVAAAGGLGPPGACAARHFRPLPRHDRHAPRRELWRVRRGGARGSGLIGDIAGAIGVGKTMIAIFVFATTTFRRPAGSGRHAASAGSARAERRRFGACRLRGGPFTAYATTLVGRAIVASLERMKIARAAKGGSASAIGRSLRPRSSRLPVVAIDESPRVGTAASSTPALRRTGPTG